MTLNLHKQVIPIEWERRNVPSTILPFFAKAFQSHDLPKKVHDLCRNLSEKDKGIVSRILNCFQRLFNGEQPNTIFTPSECEEINDYLGFVRDRTIKIKDDLYCYNGYFLPAPHFAPDIFIGRMAYDLLDNPGYLTGKDVIDAGGFIGDSALVMSSWTGERIHIFEPVSGHIAQIKKTMEYNDLKNCLLVPSGLGETKAQVEIALFDAGSSINKFAPDVFKALPKEKIQVTTLDHYVQEHNLEVGFIKIDVEGHEQPLLRGAMKTIQTQRPVLYISIYHNADDFFDIKPMIERLGLGYKFKLAKHPNGGILVETALVAEPAS